MKKVDELMALADEYAVSDWDSEILPPTARAALLTALQEVVQPVVRLSDEALLRQALEAFDDDWDNKYMVDTLIAIRARLEGGV